MFSDLLTWLANVWKFTLGIFQTVWDYTRGGFTWFVGVFYAVILIGGKVTEFVFEQVATLIGMIANFSTSNHDLAGTVAGDSLRFANTFFPVAEGFSLLTALSVLMVMGIMYRFAKSWVPTLN